MREAITTSKAAESEREAVEKAEADAKAREAAAQTKAKAAKRQAAFTADATFTEVCPLPQLGVERAWTG